MNAVTPGDWALVRSVIDTLPDHIYAKDLESRFTVANAATVAFFGFESAAQMIGKSDFDLFPHETAVWFRTEEQELLRTGAPSANREAAVADRAGRQRWLLTTKVPLRDEGGHIIGLVGVNRDITDLKHVTQQLQSTQLQLAQVEKMESIGRLAAGVAHEVKNPLAVVLMGIDILSRGGECPAETVAGVLRGMKDAVTRADRVVRGLLDFSAPSTLSLQKSCLRGVMEQALSLVKSQLLRGKVTLREEWVADLPMALLDPNKVEQVFVNLLLNAIQATPAGGTVTVRTYTQCGRGPEIVAEVDDTGPGVADEMLPKLFEPFFTTKPLGQGTGLGLSVSRTIVELHAGTIQLTKRQEGGMRATVAFIRAQG
jgi:PAS domain S-box-containing protein